MKAVVYHGQYDVRVEEVPDPRIEAPRDAIVKVTSTAICGSGVANQGYDAMLNGQGQVITGWKNKMQAAMSHVMPADQLAKQHSKQAAPGTANH